MPFMILNTKTNNLFELCSVCLCELEPGEFDVCAECADLIDDYDEMDYAMEFRWDMESEDETNKRLTK